MPIGERKSEARTEFRVRGGFFSLTSPGNNCWFGASLERPDRCVCTHSRMVSLLALDATRERCVSAIRE